eukprot:m.33130 g.33130  ORF g.33130 m.33130 type:complete len:71 (-) comp15150_c0_seq2:29-241(-)
MSLFTTSEVQEQLAALGFSHVPPDILEEFLKDLNDLALKESQQQQNQQHQPQRQQPHQPQQRQQHQHRQQ